MHPGHTLSTLPMIMNHYDKLTEIDPISTDDVTYKLD